MLPNDVAFKRTPRSVRYKQLDLLFIKFTCTKPEQKPNQLKLQMPRPTTAFRLRRWLCFAFYVLGDLKIKKKKPPHSETQ
jgi:hypothetical protein